MMHKITFEIETITPMFLSGANQSKAELRAASIKGLLRFWWRALQADSDINELRKNEASIFGGSDEGMGGSSFSIRLITNGDLKPTKDKFPSNQNYQVQVEGKTFKINILEYLAYGTYEYVQRQGNVFIREYYPAKTKFDIVLNFRDDQLMNEILKTIYVWCIFGGIGARSRNGFGSLNAMNKEEAFKDIKNILNLNNPYEQQNVQKLLSTKNSVTPYPSFTSGARLFRAKQQFNDAIDALADIGKIYKNCRSSLEKKHFFDKRQYIGSPIVEKKVTKSLLDRHAKPYFIKIAKEGTHYRAYILYLPSKYCMELNNSEQHDRKFAEVCTEFNNFLAANMETII